MPGHRKPELSVTGLVAGAAATVTATVAASYFGVGGTLIGAGAVSVLSTVGATFYQHFLDRGKAQIAKKVPMRVSAGGGGGDAPEDPAPARRTGGWPKWYVVCGAAGGVFLAVMGLVTTFELVTGKPLANTVQGRSGHGTSVHPVLTDVHPAPAPTTTGQATPDTTATPTPGPTAERTTRATPTPSASAVPPPAQRPPVSEAPTGPTTLRSPAPQELPGNEDDRTLHTP